MKESSNIEFRIAKSGHLVPVVDQVFLHSIYDPIKEAEVFVESHLSELENNCCHLILGLGFGYHAFKMLEKLKEIHGAPAQIMVIEANHELVNRFISYAKDKNIKVDFQILSGEPATLYNSDLFLNFLLKRPQVIVHKASFQKDKEYYGKVLQFQADQKLSSYWMQLRPSLRDFLSNIENKNLTIEELNKRGSFNQSWKKEDYFFHFITSIAETNVEKIKDNL